MGKVAAPKNKIRKAQEKETPGDGPIYRVRIKGEMKVGRGKNMSSKPYDVTVRMDEEMIQIGARSCFRNEIADVVLSKLDPLYVRPLTYELVEVEREDGEPVSEISVMSFEELEQYIELTGIPVNAELYGDSGELRNAIEECEADAEAYVKNEKKLADRRQSSVKVRRSAKALNAHLEDGVAQAPKAKSKTAAKPKTAAKSKSKAKPADDEDDGEDLDI